MTIRGFETSGNPLLVTLDNVEGLPNGPHTIDPNLAEAWDAGILCNVGNMRYFIPWTGVAFIQQDQTVQTPPPPSSTPANPGGGGNGGD